MIPAIDYHYTLGDGIEYTVYIKSENGIDMRICFLKIY